MIDSKTVDGSILCFLLVEYMPKHTLKLSKLPRYIPKLPTLTKINELVADGRINSENGSNENIHPYLYIKIEIDAAHLLKMNINNPNVLTRSLEAYLKEITALYQKTDNAIQMSEREPGKNPGIDTHIETLKSIRGKLEERMQIVTAIIEKRSDNAAQGGRRKHRTKRSKSRRNKSHRKCN
jgi:hypothetical protein